MSHFEIKTFRGHQTNSVVPKNPGIEYIWVWDETKRRYEPPPAGQKRFKAVKRIREAGRSRRIVKCFSTLEEARRWRALSEDQIHTSQPVLEENPYRFSDLVSDWKKATYRLLEKATSEAYDSKLRHLKFFDPYPVSELTPEVVDRWFDVITTDRYIAAQKCTRTSYRHELKLLTTILNWYAEQKNTAFASPIKKRHKKRIEVRKKRERTDWYIPEEDVRVFLDELKKLEDPLWYRVAFFQVHTGCRISEVCALSWRDIDWKNQRVRLNKKVHWARFSDWTAEIQPGTKGDKVTLRHLYSDLLPMLEEMRKEATSDLIFHKDGKILHYMAIQKAYNTAFRNAALPYSATHILRHTFATMFLDKTNDVYALKEVMDHSDLKTTLIYAKILKKKSQEAWSKLEASKGFNLTSDPSKLPERGYALTLRDTLARPHLRIIK